MKSSTTEVVETQNTIIRMQSRVIDGLYCLLMQHITAEEADCLPEKELIDKAAELRSTLN